MVSQTPTPNEDLPAAARGRLGTMRGDNSHDELFTSDLSVSEFLLVREAGFDPVGSRTWKSKFLHRQCTRLVGWQ
jgi:hypothetical protein